MYKYMYLFKCVCGKEFKKIEEAEITSARCFCGEVSSNVISCIDLSVFDNYRNVNHGLGIIKDIQPYQSQATGEWITSRSKHRDHLRSSGLREIGDQHEAHQKHLYDTKASEAKKRGKELRREIAERLYSSPR